MALTIKLKGGPLTIEDLVREHKEFCDWIPDIALYRRIRERLTLEEVRALHVHPNGSVRVQVLRVQGTDPARVAAVVTQILRADEATVAASSRGDTRTALHRQIQIADIVPSDISLEHVQAILWQYLKPAQGRTFINGNPVNDARVATWVRARLQEAFIPDCFSAALIWLASREVDLLQEVVGAGGKSRERGRTLMLNSARVGPVGRQILDAIKAFTVTLNGGR